MLVAPDAPHCELEGALIRPEALLEEVSVEVSVEFEVDDPEEPVEPDELGELDEPDACAEPEGVEMAAEPDWLSGEDIADVFPSVVLPADDGDVSLDGVGLDEPAGDEAPDATRDVECDLHLLLPPLLDSNGLVLVISIGDN